MVEGKIQESCLIIAGEKSGEEHGMSFLPSLLKKNPHLHVYGVGGDEMKAIGVEILYHLKDFSSWGFSEVIGKIPFYFRAFFHLLREVKKRKTRYAILIDFQDFNLRLAKKLAKEGVRIFYYVAPQAWAWKSWRVRDLKKSVDTLFTIIPFEREWFQKRGVSQVRSVAHPLWFHYKDRIIQERLGIVAKPFESTRKKRLLLLPGSRNFEVEKLLPIFCDYVKSHRKEFEVALVASPHVNKNLYTPYEDLFERVYSHDQISRALEWGDYALAASGTVTLTCALFSVPTVVCYASSLLNEYIFKTFISYSGPISLANIIHQRKIFPELIQNEVTEFNIEKCMRRWREDKYFYEKTKYDLHKTLDLIGGESQNAESIISQLIIKSSCSKPEEGVLA